MAERQHVAFAVVDPGGRVYLHTLRDTTTKAIRAFFMGGRQGIWSDYLDKGYCVTRVTVVVAPEMRIEA